MNGRRVLDLDSDSIASSISRPNTGNIKGADNDFVAWVEKHSDLSLSATAVSTAPDDTDSVKSAFSYNFSKTWNNILKLKSLRFHLVVILISMIT